MANAIEHHHLFGLLALQNGLIDQGALFSAFATWTRGRDRSMAWILLDQGALDSIGHLQSSTGHSDDALRSCGRALEIQQRLADANPTVLEDQKELATIYNNIGALHSSAGHPGEAPRSYQKALVTRKKFDSPDSNDLYDTACLFALISGLTESNGGRSDGATARWRRYAGGWWLGIVIWSRWPETPTSTR